MDMLLTCDPANIHHILSKNFSNYPKGPEFRKIFDMLGDGILNIDSELWKIQRKTTMSLISHANFLKFWKTCNWNKMRKGILPILEHSAQQQKEIDLVDVLAKYSYDISCEVVLGYDPCTLSVDSLNIPHPTVYEDAEEAAFYRHILPERLWKLQKWPGMGLEKKLKKSWETVDHLVARSMSKKRNKERDTNDHVIEDHAADDYNLLTSLMDEYKGINHTLIASSINPDKFLRDNAVNLLFASSDTTSVALSWFFWFLATHPSVEVKILEEITIKLDVKQGFMEGLNKLVYLHAALSETLRLFPTVPLNHISPIEAECLPSGHFVLKNMRIIISFHAVGRMQNIWGEDCMEFKPERWISERGEVKHVASNKFVAFNAGPRSCIGKDLSFMLMKIVAASVIHDYHLEMVTDHPPIAACKSVLSHMKHGFKVRVTKVNNNI